jgi:crotonobetaine/carnitine-CoA ligase
LTYRTEELTLPNVLARQARERGDRKFLTWLPDGRTWTFAEADTASTRLANGLHASGVRKGTHVALLLENSPDFLLLVCALGKLGAVVVPLNTAARGRLLQYYLDQSDAEVLIVEDELAGRIEDRSRLRSVLGRSSLKELDAAPETSVGEEVLPTDLACILYTSGTTGPSKGNMFSQSAALSVGLSNVETHGYRADDVLYACLPLFHMNALQATSFAALLAGLPLALAPRFSASGFWQEIRAAGATVTAMLGSMASILWNQPPSPDDGSGLRLAICAPIPPFAAAFERRFGLHLVSSFGISDYGLITAYTTNDPREKLGSAGRARKGFRVRIVGEDGRDLPPGQPGEIVVRCEDPGRVASGYYRMPGETAVARRDGWFHTADLGVLDADGYLSFVGRQKDAIRRRGENVSAFEVEQILDAHPAVAESAVFAVPAAGGEDEVAACVVLKPGATLAEAELVEYCRTSMAYYMVPRYIEFRAGLPRTLNHKIEKFRLREALAQDLGRAWDREAAGIVRKK